jgi:hypothetical protein
MTQKNSARRRSSGVFAFLFVAVLLAGTQAGSGAAQEPATPDMVTKRVPLRLRGSGDPNVTADSEVNARNRPSDVVPPLSKTPAGRALCSVTFDNHTDLITKIFIDGKFAGTVRPFGELSASVVPGPAGLYARAEYEDGTADAWGPVRATCRTKYLWRLAD